MESDPELERLEAILEQKRRRAIQLQQDIQLFEASNNATVALHLERVRARKMSVWWAITILLSLMCMFGSYSKGSYVMTAANLFAFLLVWRGLYVDTNLKPTLICLCICAFTLYMR